MAHLTLGSILPLSPSVSHLRKVSYLKSPDSILNAGSVPQGFLISSHMSFYLFEDAAARESPIRSRQPSLSRSPLDHFYEDYRGSPSPSPPDGRTRYGLSLSGSLWKPSDQFLVGTPFPLGKKPPFRQSFTPRLLPRKVFVSYSCYIFISGSYFQIPVTSESRPIRKNSGKNGFDDTPFHERNPGPRFLRVYLFLLVLMVSSLPVEIPLRTAGSVPQSIGYEVSLSLIRLLIPGKITIGMRGENAVVDREASPLTNPRTRYLPSFLSYSFSLWRSYGKPQTVLVLKDSPRYHFSQSPASNHS